MGLTESEFLFIQAAWIYTTSQGNEFAPSTLVPILSALHPAADFKHRERRNNIFKGLESKGFFKFSYAKTNLERWYVLDHGFEHMLDVIDIFTKLEISKLKKVSGAFGEIAYYKTSSYKETQKKINKFLRILKKAAKKKKK